MARAGEAGPTASRRGTPVARSGNLRAAVDDELYGEVDVGTLRVGALRDLDAIGDHGRGGREPAVSAVLRQVLVQVMVFT